MQTEKAKNGAIINEQSNKEIQQEKSCDSGSMQNGYINSESEMQCQQRHRETQSKEGKSQESNETGENPDLKQAFLNLCD